MKTNILKTVKENTQNSKMYDVFRFPVVKIVVGLDEARRLFLGRPSPKKSGPFSIFRKIAFANSIKIITSQSGKEIKFMDKNSKDEKDFLGWAILEKGVLDIHYKIKKQSGMGTYTYLTKFSGDDVLEHMFSFFRSEQIERLSCVLEKSNLEAFNIAFAKKPSDMIRAIRNTHLGNYVLNRQQWTISQNDIELYGEPGSMRSGMFDPAKASFQEVEAVFSPVSMDLS